MCSKGIILNRHSYWCRCSVARGCRRRCNRAVAKDCKEWKLTSPKRASPSRVSVSVYLLPTLLLKYLHLNWLSSNNERRKGSKKLPPRLVDGKLIVLQSTNKILKLACFDGLYISANWKSSFGHLFRGFCSIPEGKSVSPADRLLSHAAVVIISDN